MKTGEYLDSQNQEGDDFTSASPPSPRGSGVKTDGGNEV